jgi:endonuclease/exonuclease/phosphatase family metal-dependent hydrolase
MESHLESSEELLPVSISDTIMVPEKTVMMKSQKGYKMTLKISTNNIVDGKIHLNLQVTPDIFERYVEDIGGYLDVETFVRGMVESNERNIALFAKQSADYINTLSSDEKKYLSYYTMKAHQPINTYLRGDGDPNPEVSNAVRGITRILRGAPKVKHDFVVYRGQAKHFGMHFKSFVSTSLSLNIAERFSSATDTSVIYMIRVEAGQRALYINAVSEYSLEAEVLLPKDTKFQEIGKSKYKYLRYRNTIFQRELRPYRVGGFTFSDSKQVASISYCKQIEYLYGRSDAYVLGDEHDVNSPSWRKIKLLWTDAPEYARKKWTKQVRVNKAHFFHLQFKAAFDVILKETVTTFNTLERLGRQQGEPIGWALTGLAAANVQLAKTKNQPIPMRTVDVASTDIKTAMIQIHDAIVRKLPAISNCFAVALNEDAEIAETPEKLGLGFDIVQDGNAIHLEWTHKDLPRWTVVRFWSFNAKERPTLAAKKVACGDMRELAELKLTATETEFSRRAEVTHWRTNPMLHYVKAYLADVPDPSRGQAYVGESPLDPKRLLSFCDRSNLKNTIRLHPRGLRIMSYNVHNWVQVCPEKGRIESTKLQDLIRFVQKNNVSVLALQEVTSFYPNRAVKGAELPGFNMRQLQDFGFKYVYVSDSMETATGSDKKFQLCNVILSHYPISHKSTVQLGMDNRIAQSAVLTVNERYSFVIVNTHLSYKPEANKHNIKRLNGYVAKLDRWCKGPLVLCGDLNHYRAPYNIITGIQEGESVAMFAVMPRSTGPSVTALQQCASLDYFLVNQTLLGCTRITFQGAILLPFSDHMPILMDMIPNEIVASLRQGNVTDKLIVFPDYGRVYKVDNECRIVKKSVISNRALGNKLYDDQQRIVRFQTGEPLKYTNAELGAYMESATIYYNVIMEGFYPKLPPPKLVTSSREPHRINKMDLAEFSKLSFNYPTSERVSLKPKAKRKSQQLDSPTAKRTRSKVEMPIIPMALSTDIEGKHVVSGN